MLAYYNFNWKKKCTGHRTQRENFRFTHYHLTLVEILDQSHHQTPGGSLDRVSPAGPISPGKDASRVLWDLHGSRGAHRCTICYLACVLKVWWSSSKVVIICFSYSYFSCGFDCPHSAEHRSLSRIFCWCLSDFIPLSFIWVFSSWLINWCSKTCFMKLGWRERGRTERHQSDSWGRAPWRHQPWAHFDTWAHSQDWWSGLQVSFKSAPMIVLLESPRADFH